MHVAIICIDKAGHHALRQQHREAHLAYIAATGIAEIAGPFLEDGAMVGSLLILKVGDLQQARDWAAADPYNQAGLFERVEIREWKKTIG